MLRLVFLACLIASPAAAGVLPITGSYCGEDEFVDSNSESTDVSECRFVSITESGPTWHIVAVKCQDGATGHLRVAVSADKRSISISDPDEVSEPVRLDRCPS